MFEFILSSVLFWLVCYPDTLKTYILPSVSKGALRMMAYSAPAMHHLVLLVSAVEIAIVVSCLMMLLSSCSSGCKCGESCINKPFQQRPVKKMRMIQTEKCGVGIVADEEINQGEFVIEYVGEVIDDKTCEERLWNMKHRGETNFYLCEINRNMVIDATYKGNKSRYINHSCCPNTEMQKWIIDGETRIGIFATRDIKMGEHLTYDYHHSVHSNKVSRFEQFGADQDCHCGAAGCRQKLGVKPTKAKLSSDAALRLVTCQVGVSSPRLKAFLSGKDVLQNGRIHKGNSGCAYDERKSYHSCIGKVITILSSTNKRCFGIIRQFDKYSRKHKDLAIANNHEEVLHSSSVV
ncbi:Histone-lysine N-methyltransferase ASHH3 [Linum perenne]